MMKDVRKFRALKENEIDEAVNLVRTSFEDKYLISSIYRTKGIKKFISLELKNKFSNYLYYVLTNEKDILAFVEFKLFNFDKIAFLNIIAVNNKYKNEGIGGKMISYSKQKLINDAYKTIQLDVFNSNKIAYNWYSSIGFKSLSNTNFYKIDKIDQENSSIKINNFAQFKIVYRELGFSMLDIINNNQNDRVGVISKDFIIRGNNANQSVNEIFFLSKKIGIKNVYLIGNINKKENYNLLDVISRMELKIS